MQAFPIKKSIKFKFFFIFILMNFIFSIAVVFSLYSAYYNASLAQLENTCDNYIEMSKVGLSTFIGDVFSVTYRINNDEDLLHTLKMLTSEPLETQHENLMLRTEASLSRHLYANPKLLALSLHLLGDATDSTVSVIAGDGFSPRLLENTQNWIQLAEEGDGRVVFCSPYQTNAFTDSDHTNPVISFYKLIKNEKTEHLAVLSIDMAGNSLSNILQNIKLPGNSRSYVVNAEGIILASTDFNLIGRHVAVVPGLAEYVDTGDTRILQNSAANPLLIKQQSYYFEDWRIITLASQSEILQIKELFQKSFLSLLVYLTITVILASLVMTTLFTKPIKRLLDSINVMRHGDLSTRIQNISPDEIGLVQQDINSLMDSVETLVQESYDIKLREKDALIKSMESQINPHFLYNTLDIINWKVLELGGYDICKMITTLSQILRYSINNQKKIVTLKEELQQIESYLFIQQIRYQDSLLTQMNIAPETLSLKIHKLLLQPIVENAIVHGLEQKGEDARVSISTYLLDDTLVLEVYDNGKGIPQERLADLLIEKSILDGSERFHIGINNVHNRLRSYYGEHFGLRIESQEGRYTKISLVFPIIT